MLALPKVFPMILSLGDPSALAPIQAPDGVSTNLFLMNFLPDAGQGTVGFTSLRNENLSLNAENADDLRLSALAITLDAWRILHRLTTESEAARNRVFGCMQAGSCLDLPLVSTGRDWTLRNYAPHPTTIAVLGQRIFSDGENTPPLTGRASLVHATGRMLDVQVHPADLGVHLAVGWVSPETEAVQVVYADGQKAHTQNYYLSFSGAAFRGLQAYLDAETPLETALALGALVSVACGETQALIVEDEDVETRGSRRKTRVVARNRSLRAEVDNDSAALSVFNAEPRTRPFFPLPLGLETDLWDRAVRQVTQTKLH